MELKNSIKYFLVGKSNKVSQNTLACWTAKSLTSFADNVLPPAFSHTSTQRGRCASVTMFVTIQIQRWCHWISSSSRCHQSSVNRQHQWVKIQLNFLTCPSFHVEMQIALLKHQHSTKIYQLKMGNAMSGELTSMAMPILSYIYIILLQEKALLLATVTHYSTNPQLQRFSQAKLWGNTGIVNSLPHFKRLIKLIKTNVLIKQQT